MNLYIWCHPTDEYDTEEYMKLKNVVLDVWYLKPMLIMSILKT